MDLKIWILGGLIAAALGVGLAFFLRMPALVLASVVVCAGAAFHAGSAGGSISLQIAFSVYLLMVLQAAYLGTALLRGNSRD